MRPDAIRSAKEQVYKVLWTHPNHELVAQVRKQILKNHSGLADEISTGRLLTGESLAKTLNELGANGPFVLAAVLWALEFKGPSAEMLFRILVPLAVGEDSQIRRQMKTSRATTSEGAPLRLNGNRQGIPHGSSVPPNRPRRICSRRPRRSREQRVNSWAPSEISRTRGETRGRPTPT